MIEAIVFDFAGVISTEGYNRWLQKNVKDALSDKMQYFMDAASIGDLGIEPMEKYLSLLSSGTGIKSDQIWVTMRKEFVIDPKLIHLIEVLKNTYKIGLVSNFTARWIRQILTEENLFKYFDGITISSEIHSIKPEKEIFEDICKKLNTPFADTVFIDDKSENVEGAVKLGINGIHFTSFDKLRIELTKLGIIY